jgi:hypothetical protein
MPEGGEWAARNDIWPINAALRQRQFTPEVENWHTRMSEMRSPIKLVLVGALLIEALNLKLFAFPMDAGLPASIPWYTRLLAGQWLLLHLPGVVSLGWLDRVGLERYDSFVLFVSGYLETVSLLIAGIVFFQWIRDLSMRGARRPDASAVLRD